MRFSPAFSDFVAVYSGQARTVYALPQLTGASRRLGARLCVSRDSISFVYTDNNKTNVGDYAASASMASGFPSANYAVSASTATRNWSITPKTITVQITEAYSTRLDAFSYLYDRTEQGIGVTVNGICGSDVVMFLNIETEGELSTAGFNSQKLAEQRHLLFYGHKRRLLLSGAIGCQQRQLCVLAGRAKLDNS